MRSSRATYTSLNQSGQNLVRVIIASYFLAVPLGLISGTTPAPLMAPFLPEPHAEIAGGIFMFVGAYLVLTGAWLRASALLLATTLFWSSYIENAGTGNIDGFWRDIALIGALILTYTQTLPRAESRRSALHWTPPVRRIKPEAKVTPRRIVAAKAKLEEPAGPNLKVVPLRTSTEPAENIFREDPGIRMVG